MNNLNGKSRIKITISVVVCICVLIGALVFISAQGGMQTVTSAEQYKNFKDLVPDEAITSEDEKISNTMKNTGMFFKKVSDEKAEISKDDAIKKAAKEFPESMNFKELTCEFLLYNNLAQNIVERPVWVIKGKGALKTTGGGFRRDSDMKIDVIPDNVETIIVLDSLTGDIISAYSMGHR